MTQQTHLQRLLQLAQGVLFPEPGIRRILLAFGYGILCHLVFAMALIAMIWMMFFGMSRSFGAVPQPWAILANAFLVLQFPLAHSLLLSRKGRRYLGWLAPQREGARLSTTSFAIVASVQLLALFTLWTPSGIVWWQATGTAFFALCTAYAAAWLLLIKATWDAGMEVQSGALGWMSMAAGRTPVYPPMPQRGTFRLIRHPIYLSFALTLWTVPVWTPDQLALAVTLTIYCLAAPILKERRLSRRFGNEFHEYKRRTPYMLPRRRV
ncbi:MAG: isoprenylcysteine carboxylmethyltransferase family protein [Pseudomonadota bacterium]